MRNGQPTINHPELIEKDRGFICPNGIPSGEKRSFLSVIY